MLKELCEQTDTLQSEWEEMGGPETGVGVERWFFNESKAMTAYCVNDQGHITIEVTGDDYE
jgi:hypothetical protein